MTKKKTTTKNKKTDDLVFKIGKPAVYLKLMKDSGISEEVFATLRKGINKELREVNKHMKEDGWDLSLDHIKHECLQPLTGNWYEWYIMARLCSKGYVITSKTNEHTGMTGLVVSKTKRKRKSTQ